MSPAPAIERGPSTISLLLYFLRLGTFGFGGPIALAGRMERDLVDERRWVSRQDYLEGLAFSQLSPGPLAAQLAMYIGWAQAGWLGAALVAAAFVLPSFLMAVVVAAAYVVFGQLAWLHEAFYGIGAAVIAIIVQSAYRLSRKTIGSDAFLWSLFGVVAVTTVWTGSELIWLFVLCGVLRVVFKCTSSIAARPALLSISIGMPWLLSGLSGSAPVGVVTTIGLFFLKAGAFVFGSGLAIVPFLYGGVVKQYQWLTEQQFLDAIAVAMITPGPVVITAAFIGYLVAGLAGSVAATTAVFAPPFLIVIIAAPYYQRVARNEHVKAFVQGVTAAAVGAIAGAAIILARRALIDMPTVLIATGMLVALFKLKRLPEPLLIVLAGVVGIAVQHYRGLMR